MPSLKKDIEIIIKDFDNIQIDCNNSKIYSKYVDIMFPEIDYNIEVINSDDYFSDKSVSSFSNIKKIARGVGHKMSYKKWKLLL